ncbi:hypothetical protein [uncultured Parabacteroides sp.]|uniref:hypothetical protein n=1 Tax=uncultured Parabacteroides sp. TaxID=512312 RepID=UPI00260DF18D|nr:hypothetical protein [uncultured Parabacteroides sp.]
MDKLKNFIDTNRDAFEEDEMLPEGHLERFEQKLPKPRKNRVTLYSLSAFAIAASIALLLLFRLPGGTDMSDPALRSAAQTCDSQEEIEELRLYYNMQMNDVLAQMKKLYKQDRTPGAEELLQESKRILTDNYMFEETVLPTLPCSNDGLFAMTQHYNNSLEGLTLMLKQMRQVTDKEK